MASSNEEDERHHRSPIKTWYCAQPARYCSGPWRTRPSLVQQMQHFDNEQQLAETIDMSSVNYLTSLFLTRQIHQRCSNVAAHSTRKPLFIWTRDAHDDADSDSEGFSAFLGAGSVAATRRPTTTRSMSRSQLSYSLSNVVVVAYKTRTKTTGGSPEWRFCTAGTCIVMRLNNARDYEIYEYAVLLAVWKARRRNQVRPRYLNFGNKRNLRPITVPC